jgi:hypothetical protein
MVHQEVGAIIVAWQRILTDCGCPDMFYCPTTDDVECPRHGGFSVCCDGEDLHVPVPTNLRLADPRPGLPDE